MDENPQLEYQQRASFISQKQYRRLMALTLLNTVLLAGFVCGPWLLQFGHTQWNQFQSRRAAARALAARIASFTAARTYSAPADQLVYEERPIEAAKLMASGAFRDFADSVGPHFPMQDWQPPVARKSSLFGGSTAIVFAHGLKDPAGNERIVIVEVSAEQRFSSPHTSDGKRYYPVNTGRQLRLVSTDLQAEDQHENELYIRFNRPDLIVCWTPKGDDWDHGTLDYDTNSLMRLYAGQTDAADPSHFTIDYGLGSTRGRIDGWLRKNGYVEVRTRVGEVTWDAHHDSQTWTLPAGPTTRAR